MVDGVFVVMIVLRDQTNNCQYQILEVVCVEGQKLEEERAVYSAEMGQVEVGLAYLGQGLNLKVVAYSPYLVPDLDQMVRWYYWAAG